MLLSTYMHTHVCTYTHTQYPGHSLMHICQKEIVIIFKNLRITEYNLCQ